MIIVAPQKSIVAALASALPEEAADVAYKSESTIIAVVPIL